MAIFWDSERLGMPAAAGPWADDEPENGEQDSSARLRRMVRDFMVKLHVLSILRILRW